MGAGHWLRYRGVLPLVIQLYLCPFRPRFKFHPESHRAILKFARGVFGLPILTFLAIQTDVIVLGKVVTTEQLGKYAMVYTLARLPMELFVQMFGRVMLSAYSEKQDSLEYLSDSVLRLVRAIAMLGVPLILFMALYAKPLLTLVFGASFAEVSVAFRLLAIVSLLRTQEVIATAMYLAIGQPHLHRRFIALRAVIIVVLIYPAAVAFGLVGSASVILLGNAIAMVMQVYWLHKRIGLSIKAYVYCWFEDIWLCLIVIIPLVLLQFMRFKNPVSYMVLGAVAYFVACCVGLFRIYRHILHKQ
ncbi:MAG: hypothetical protein DRP65_02305 [Planctomycetota bacterium]|nr:MAG: hypothetical protein DRP65_02305 [Planctomycetota bacterium]